MNEDRVSEKTVAEVAARAGKAFERLVQTMAALRAPDGCPARPRRVPLGCRTDSSVPHSIPH